MRDITNFHPCFRSRELKEYFVKLKSTVGNKPYTYRSLPTELKIMKLHRKITDNGIAKAIDKSGAGNTWILIY